MLCSVRGCTVHSTWNIFQVQRRYLGWTIQPRPTACCLRRYKYPIMHTNRIEESDCWSKGGKNLPNLKSCALLTLMVVLDARYQVIDPFATNPKRTRTGKGTGSLKNSKFEFVMASHGSNQEKKKNKNNKNNNPRGGNWEAIRSTNLSVNKHRALYHHQFVVSTSRSSPE